MFLEGNIPFPKALNLKTSCLAFQTNQQICCQATNHSLSSKVVNDRFSSLIETY